MMQKWFTRFPQEVIDPVYLNSITEATKFFMAWFSNGVVTYTSMLAKMHKIVSKNGYLGYTCSSGPLVVNNGFRGDEPAAWYPILKKEWFTGISDEHIIRPKVKNVPPEQGHWLQNLAKGYQLHLPDGKYVRNYLHLLGRLMDEIRLPHGSNLLVALANYMQLFVVGHPFEKINFSICMAQINTILYMKGYKTLYHRWMDFECFLYDYTDIESKFVMHLLTQST